MNIMNKVFWYSLIFAAIAVYFYVGYSFSSSWKVSSKYTKKITLDKYRNQYPKLSLKDTREGDFYVIIDSNENKKFFRVIGLTTDSLLCVNYGKDESVLPADVNFSSYWLETKFIDKAISWVDELMKNEENFNAKLDFLSSKDLDSLLKTHKVIGYMTYQKQYLTSSQLMMELMIGNPILLLLLILGITCFLFIFENLVNIYIPKSKEPARWFVFLMIIFSYSLFHYNFKITFITCTLVFIIFQYLNQRLISYSFEKKEFLKYFTIVTLGILFQVFLWMIKDSFLSMKVNDNHKIDLNISVLRQAFIVWTTVATANFLHNLIRYIYSLRRKSKQLQTVTSDAQKSSDALLQSETNVNTHFLYNSLHAIAALAPVAPDKTETLALSLAKYYRYATNRNDETWIPVNEEVEALTAYLEVENIRMGEKLSYDFEIKDDVLSVKIPKFLLQPLVENAIKYGYNSENDSTKISITAIKNDDGVLKISVFDSGKPFSDNMEIGTGIKYINDQLKRFYPDGHTISFENEPEKCVEILLNTKKMN